MNYFDFHPGDFYALVQGLDLEGQGITVSLISRMVTTEKPIKTQWVKLGFPKESQQKAMDILESFFEETPDGWIFPQVWERVLRYQSNRLKNQENGKKGGRPRKHPCPMEEPKNNPVGSCSVLTEKQTESLTSNQEPVTNNQDFSTSSSSNERKKDPVVLIPEAPEQEWIEAAKAIREDVDPLFVWRKMADYYKGSRKAMKTWRRVLMDWVGREHGSIRRTASTSQAFNPTKDYYDEDPF